MGRTFDKMLTEKQLEEIKDWLDKSQNPVFFFHNDLDGLVSYLLLKRYSKKGKGVVIKSYPELSKSYARKINELKPDAIFILDAPLVEEEFFSEAKMQNIPVIWIDHHPIQKIEGINYYNPLEGKSPNNEPVSYWCYMATKKDMWVSFIGCISDWYLPDFFNQFKKEYPDLVGDAKNIDEVLYNTETGKLIQVLNFAMKDTISNVIKMAKLLEEASSPYDLLSKDAKYKSIWERFYHLEKIFKKIMDKAIKEAEESDKLVFFRYSGEMKLSNEISNKLLYLFPKKIIAVAHIKGERTSISLRGEKVRLYLEHVLKKIEGRGGGHEKACAASIKVEDIPQFIEEFQKQIK